MSALLAEPLSRVRSEPVRWLWWPYLPRGKLALLDGDPGVGGVLSALALLAERTDCAILLVRHLRKEGAARAIHRGLGSIGFIASVRAGLLAARHPADPSLGVLTVSKANLAGPAPSLG